MFNIYDLECIFKSGNNVCDSECIFKSGNNFIYTISFISIVE